MTEWTSIWSAAASVASVLIARWYGRSWRAVAEALTQRQRRGAGPSPEAPAAQDRAGRGEHIGVR